MNYERNIVICAFRASHPDDLNVTDAELADFDETLFDFYDAEVRSQAGAQNIPADDFNVSMLVFFATRSTAQLVKTRVKHACTYFLSTTPTP